MWSASGLPGNSTLPSGKSGIRVDATPRRYAPLARLTGRGDFVSRRLRGTVGEMSGPSRVSRSSMAVVGAGAAGTLTAARLIDEAGRRQRALDITLLDPR